MDFSLCLDSSDGVPGNGALSAFRVSASQLETLCNYGTQVVSQSASKPWGWIVFHVKQSQKCNLKTLSHVYIPLFGNLSRSSFRDAFKLWQSNKNRCQAVIPGNKWDCICRLFDRQRSLGKYELSLLVCRLCASLEIYLVVDAFSP